MLAEILQNGDAGLPQDKASWGTDGGVRTEMRTWLGGDGSTGPGRKAVLQKRLPNAQPTYPGEQQRLAYPSRLPIMVCKNLRAEICPRNFR